MLHFARDTNLPEFPPHQPATISIGALSRVHLTGFRFKRVITQPDCVYTIRRPTPDRTGRTPYLMLPVYPIFEHFSARQNASPQIRRVRPQRSLQKRTRRKILSFEQPAKKGVGSLEESPPLLSEERSIEKMQLFEPQTPSRFLPAHRFPFDPMNLPG